MQKTWKKKLLSLILSTMLIVAMAFCMTACGGNNTETPNTEVLNTETSNTSNSEESVQGDATAQTDATVLGEGASTFAFVVVDGDGVETAFEIHTDKATVGEALLELELIEGEAGDFGLYVKTVNGITADYDVDGTYWAFYINGDMAMTGVDATNIEDGAVYAFKVEK